jgi:hypothetical protein
VAGAAGTVSNAWGVYVGIGHFGAGTASITSANGVYVSQPQTAAGRTISASTGINVQNQGNTGITTAIGVDIATQSGAATTNLGLRSQSPVVIGGTSISGSESLRVSGGGARIDGSSLVAAVTSSLSLNNSGGSINIGNNADAQALNIGTGAAARTIAIGNQTGATTLGFNYGTGGAVFSQGAATSSTPAPWTFTGAAHTGLANAEVTDANWNLARTVSFSGGGGAIANQRAIRIQAPTYAAAAAQTITTASTVEISGQPSQGANVTISPVGLAAGAYALNVSSGNSRFGGSVYVRDTATAPGVQGIYYTDSSGNGFRAYQLTAATTWFDNVGSSTGFMFSGNVTLRNTLQSFADGSYDIGTSSARFKDIYNRRSFVKNHSAFTGSELVLDTAATQTTTATTTSLYTLAIPDNSMAAIDVVVIARATASADRAYYTIRAGVYRNAAGAATILGSVVQTSTESVAGWDATITVSGNNAIVSVTSTAVTINWACNVRYQAVVGNT